MTAASVAAVKHEPISAEAKGRLRILKRELAAAYQRFDAVYSAWASKTNSPLSDFMLKRGKGRERVFDRLNGQMLRIGAVLEGVRLEGKQPVALWSILRPRRTVRSEPAHPRDNQNCICLNHFAVGALSEGINGKPAGIHEGLWTLEFTDHCLGRRFDRARIDDHAAALADMKQAMFAAHRAALRVDREHLDVLLREPGELILAVPGGAWAIQTVISHDLASGIGMHVIVRTFYSRSMLDDRQEARLIGPAKPGRAQLGQWWLAPRCFVRFEREGTGVRASRAVKGPQPPPLLALSERAAGGPQADAGGHSQSAAASAPAARERALAGRAGRDLREENMMTGQQQQQVAFVARALIEALANCGDAIAGIDGLDPAEVQRVKIKALNDVLSSVVAAGATPPRSREQQEERRLKLLDEHWDSVLSDLDYAALLDDETLDRARAAQRFVERANGHRREHERCGLHPGWAGDLRSFAEAVRRAAEELAAGRT